MSASETNNNNNTNKYGRRNAMSLFYKLFFFALGMEPFGNDEKMKYEFYK